MKATPRGWPRITNSLFYEDASAAIDWLCRAFGFEVRLKVEGEGGRIDYSELTFGDGLLSVSSVGGDKPEHMQMVSPRSLQGKNTTALCVFVDDVEAHCARARSAGAEIFRELVANDYGEAYPLDRTYGARDCEGHLWFFMQRLRDPR